MCQIFYNLIHILFNLIFKEITCLSYYLFHFKNFKFKKIDKRNNPFIKELPHRLIFQSFIVFICFGAGLSLNTFYEHDAYVSLLGQITKFFDAINFLIDAVKQAMIEFYKAILQSRFN